MMLFKFLAGFWRKSMVVLLLILFVINMGLGKTSEKGVCEEKIGNFENSWNKITPDENTSIFENGETAIIVTKNFFSYLKGDQEYRAEIAKIGTQEIYRTCGIKEIENNENEENILIRQSVIFAYNNENGFISRSIEDKTEYHVYYKHIPMDFEIRVVVILAIKGEDEIVIGEIIIPKIDKDTPPKKKDTKTKLARKGEQHPLPNLF